jgi:hypothetical protein
VRLSLQSVLESHDILIVNPRKDVLGDGSQPEILTNFIVHMSFAVFGPAQAAREFGVALDDANVRFELELELGALEKLSEVRAPSGRTVGWDVSPG